MTTIRRITTAALRLLNCVQANETPSPEDISIAQQALSLLLDSWSADHLLIYSVQPLYVTYTGGKRDYTFGPNGDWNHPRPMNIKTMTVSYGGSLVNGVLTGSNVVDMPIHLSTDTEFAFLSSKLITSPIPTVAYDDGAYPLRTITLFPVPSASGVITIWTWDFLNSDVSLDAEIQFPPGYERMIKFNLAMEIAAEFGKDIPQQVALIAMESLGKVKRMNFKPQRLSNTPEFPGHYPGFDVYTGGFI